MRITLIPLMAGLHLRYPSYNAVTLCDIVHGVNVDAVATTALSAALIETRDGWKDTLELALPLAVVPWLKTQNIALHGCLEASPDPTALADFHRFAQEYPQVQQKIQQVEVHLRPLQSLLDEALTIERIHTEVLPILRDYFQAQQEFLDEGPSTDWIVPRCASMVAKLSAIDVDHVAVLAPIDQLAALEAALTAQNIAYAYPTSPAPSEAARTRALLDFAFRGDMPEPAHVLAQLRELAEDMQQPKAIRHEALFHQVSILLSHAHLAEASDILEKLAAQPLDEPYFLPSYVLARLGQIRDLRNERDGAMRAYKTVLALDWAHPDAIRSAQEGIKQPFGSDDGDDSAGSAHELA